MVETDCDLQLLYHVNHSTHDPWHWLFIACYAVLAITSLVANGSLLVALTNYYKKRRQQQNRLSDQNLLIRPLKPCDRTRDLLISHLAILDILLSITMPLTAIDGLSKFWPLGNNTEIVCQLTKTAPSVVVYSSSILIIVIAFNRYRQITCPHKRQLSPGHLKYTAAFIFTLAIIMSIPQFYHTRLLRLSDYTESQTPNITAEISMSLKYGPEETSGVSPIILNRSSPSNLPVAKEKGLINKTSKKEEYLANPTQKCPHHDENGWSHVVYCIEEWPFGEEYLDPKSRLYYSSFAFIVQLFIPLFVISICYFSIYRRLKKQSLIRKELVNSIREDKARIESRRCKARNKQMVIISSVYLVSWLPLGVINVVLDAFPDILGKNSAHTTMMFLCCHLIGMSSASVNPIIYGYNNAHIRKGMSKTNIYFIYLIFIKMPNRPFIIYIRLELNEIRLCISSKLFANRRASTEDSDILDSSKSKQNKIEIDKNSQVINADPCLFDGSIPPVPI